MKDLKYSIDAGKQDAQRFIKEEKIDYSPFIAISDLHLVRKTVPISFASFKQTIAEKDPELWSAVDAASARHLEELGADFNADGYAEGFAEGVAAVWDTIRDQVLKD
jgi:hypothetical protein